ncbi:RHS repeat-associated core domain-containing protein [Pantoea phytobeneficialis]|nr:RHS repeat-associated core domain-containing protein [Pantoea phytobeneficialis]MDO6408471.1 RHS repeat-associated core domain-containing protein [Pantoea phytobeneficialis]
MQSNGNIMQREQYRYCVPGTRVLKSSSQKNANSVQQHVIRYLPGIEMRMRYAGTRQKEKLTVITVNNLRIYCWLSGMPEGTDNQLQRHSIQNRNHSSTLEIDGEAGVISREEYYPYGGTAIWLTRSQIEACYKTLHYSGKERDITGLVYYGYRYYSSWIMRWMNPDPAGRIDGLNLFSMVENNPETFNDHDGLARKNSDKTHITYKQGFIAWKQQELWKNPNWDVKTGRALYGKIDKTSLLDESFIIDPPSHNYVCLWANCNYQSNLQKNYHAHLKDIHSDGRPFKCDWEGCGLDYIHSSGLAKHYNTHTRDKTYFCDQAGCNRSFFYPSALAQHLAKHENLRNYRCEKCNRGFNTSGELSQHIRIVHAVRRDFFCQESGCKKTFKSLSELKIHINRCHKEHRYCCDDCGLSFSTRRGLSIHINTHTGDTPYKCHFQNCDYEAGHPFSLTRHLLKKHEYNAPDGRCKNTRLHSHPH